MISLNIIAGHSPNGFQRLVRDARPYVGETICVVDSDAPKGMFSGFTGVKYHLRKLGDAFGAQRNYAIEQSKGDWILVLDTDETLPTSLWKRLVKITEECNASSVAIPRRNIIEGVSKTLSWPDYGIRLFKRHLRYEGKIHEHLVLDGAPYQLLPTDDNAIIHRKTAHEQRRNIMRYSRILGAKQGIVVFEWKRPNYLSVCLDSLQKCEGIADWPIYLSIDGPEHFDSFHDSFNRVAHVVPWQTHAGNLWHVTRSLEFAFECGLERVLFLDGDCIVRPDALTSLATPSHSDLFVSLTASEQGEESLRWLTPMGNVIEADRARPLLEYVMNCDWVGKQRPEHVEVMDCEYPGYDAVFCRYMLDAGMTTRYRDKSYAGHIGVVGLDCHEHHLEQRLFSGDRSQWLENAATLFREENHPTLVPADFRYET